MTEGYKRCSACGQELPLTEFNRRSNGYQAYCRKCQKEKVYEYRRRMKANRFNG